MSRPAWLDDLDLFRDQVRLIGRHDLTEEQVLNAFKERSSGDRSGWSDGTWLMLLKALLPPVAVDDKRSVTNEESWHSRIPGSSGCGKPLDKCAKLNSHLAKPLGQRTKLGHAH